jgi:hypothetical protein
VAHRGSVCQPAADLAPQWAHGLTSRLTAVGLNTDSPYSASAQPMAAAVYNRFVSVSAGATTVTAPHRWHS